MKIGILQIMAGVLLAVAAGCIGAFAAGEWREGEQGQGLHAFVHDELDLDAEQSAALEQLEADLVIERRQLELSLRAANAKLAVAMEEEHEYGPQVSAAIDDVHARMGDLQKATVRHVFSMRDLLTEEQRSQFDRKVSASLIGEAGE